MPRPLSFRWDDEFVARIDAARGSTPRSTFVRQVLEAALSGDTQAANPGPAAEAAGRGGHSHTGSTGSAIAAVPARGASRPTAPPRAPVRRPTLEPPILRGSPSPSLARFAEAARKTAPPKKRKP